MTEHQQLQQCDGPLRPTVKKLVELLRRLPSHAEIRAVTVNGQTGKVLIETYYEGLEQVTDGTTIEKGKP